MIESAEARARRKAATLNCGCRITLKRIPADIEITHCPLHATAPDMYKALKAEEHTAEGHGHPCQGCDAIRKSETPAGAAG